MHHVRKKKDSFVIDGERAVGTRGSIRTIVREPVAFFKGRTDLLGVGGNKSTGAKVLTFVPNSREMFHENVASELLN